MQSLPFAVSVLAVAFFVAIAFQTFQLVRERSNHTNISVGQEPTLQQIAQLRQHVEALAGDAAQLAAGGNGAAHQVVDELAKQNIAIRPRTVVPTP
jgi:uncharacterized membrane protein